MENSITINLPSHDETGLCLNSFGHSVTQPCHQYGPAVRSCYLIHYILDGKGEFTVNNVHYQLSRGQGFLIEPDYQTTYCSDAKDPWTYIWVGFSGTEAAQLVASVGLSQDAPVFLCEEGDRLKRYVLEMLHHNRSNPIDAYHTMGMFYLFISTIAQSRKDQLPTMTGNDYVRHAISYIQRHLAETIRTEDIAEYIGLNRSYFSVLFKNQTGLSPNKYLQTLRVAKARHLLETSRLSIESIACSCGYQKPESLIKVFRQFYGISPAAYRKRVNEHSMQTARRMTEAGVSEDLIP